MTNDLERRIAEHNNEQGKATHPYAPFETILTENYPNRIEARRREKYLKSGVEKEFLKKL